MKRRPNFFRTLKVKCTIWYSQVNQPRFLITYAYYGKKYLRSALNSPFFVISAHPTYTILYIAVSGFKLITCMDSFTHLRETVACRRYNRNIWAILLWWQNEELQRELKDAILQSVANGAHMGKIPFFIWILCHRFLEMERSQKSLEGGFGHFFLER